MMRQGWGEAGSFPEAGERQGWKAGSFPDKQGCGRDGMMLATSRMQGCSRGGRLAASRTGRGVAGGDEGGLAASQRGIHY